MGLKMEIRKLSEQFSRNGYVVIDHFVSTDVCKKITSDAKLIELSGDLKKVKLSNSNFKTINGADLCDQIAEIKNVNEACKKIARSITGKMLEDLENRQIGVSLNILSSEDKFQFHYDRNEITVVLYLNSVEGGEMVAFPRFRRSPNPDVPPFFERLLNRLDQVKRRVSFLFPKVMVDPLPGRIFIFEGRETLHSVAMVEGEVSRVSLQFAYDLEGMEFTKEQTAGYYGY